MTKRIPAILLALLFVMSTALAETAFLEKVLSILEDGKDLIQMNGDDLLDLIGIEPEEYTDFVYLTGNNELIETDDSAREVFVIRAADEDAAGRIADLLENYRQERMRLLRNYPDRADAYRQLNQAEVLREGLMVVLSVAAPDPAEPELLLQEE